MKSSLSKLGLGTVQFGLKYGINNSTGGKTPPDEVTRILGLCAEHEIWTLDTATRYGDSERVLGEQISKIGQPKFRIISKFSLENGANLLAADVERALDRQLATSLENLKVSRYEGLLLHSFADIAGPHGQHAWAKLVDYKNRGICNKIGVSLYHPEEVFRILDQFPIDMVQIPLSVFDQGMIRSGALKLLKRQGVEVHTRSLYLQGLLFADVERLAPYFNPIKPKLIAFHNFLRRSEMSAVSCAWSFVQNLPEVDKVIVGVEQAEQLEELLTTSVQSTTDADELSDFHIDDRNFTAPYLWKVT